MKQTVRKERIYSLADTIIVHEAVLNAVAMRDVEKAQSEMRRHLERSTNNLSHILLHKQLVSRVAH